jgi:lipid-A-disaccharide synthase
MDVLPHALRLSALASRLERSAARYAAALLVDAHGFTLPLGRRLRARGLPVVLLSAPQVWAWGAWRGRTLGACVDVVGCLLPFEPDALRALGARCALRFVGHPLAEREPPGAAPRTTCLVLPGSRGLELQRLAGVLHSAALTLHALGVVEAVSVVVPEERLDAPSLAGMAPRAGAEGAWDALSRARVALACSGTVTLECALAGVPAVVAYRTDPVTAFIARRVLTVPHLALPSVLLGRPLYPEVLQDAVTPTALVRAALDALDPARLPALDTARSALRAMLRVPGGHAHAVLALLTEALDRP